MFVIDRNTNSQVEVSVSRVSPRDLNLFSKGKFYFDWKLEKKYDVYQLKHKETAETLGLISIQHHEEDIKPWTEVRLIAVSKANRGSTKQYDGIASSLLVFAARHAIEKYGVDAVISGFPKTAIRNHYKQKYGFIDTGKTISMFYEQLRELINRYNTET